MILASLLLNAGPSEQFQKEIRPILESHCYECHGPEKHKADLNLASYAEYAQVAADPEIWQRVLERVQASVKDFEAAADKVQIRAGGALAQEVRDCGVAMRQEVGKALEEFHRVVPNRQTDAVGARPNLREQKWLVVGLALAIAVLCLGFWMGVRLG